MYPCILIFNCQRIVPFIISMTMQRNIHDYMLKYTHVNQLLYVNVCAT